MSSSSLPEIQNDPQLSVQQGKSSRRGMKRWMIIFLVIILLLGGSGLAYLLFHPRVHPLALPKLSQTMSSAQIGLANWQDYQQPLPTDPLNDPLLPATPQAATKLALLEDAAGQALIKQGKLDQGLAYLKAAAQSDIDNLRYSNDYRVALRNQRHYQDESAFFTPLAKDTQNINTNIDMALTYVDLMRSCPKPPDGLVCQAQFSSRSISLLDAILKKQPDNIIARYARGLNHLYWPTLMGHLPKSQDDLQYAVALAISQKSINAKFIPDAYTALGDVFAKDGKTDDARNVWLNGLNETSNQTLLKSRLAIPTDQLVSQEDQQLRGLGVYVDTDLSLFW